MKKETNYNLSELANLLGSITYEIEKYIHIEDSAMYQKIAKEMNLLYDKVCKEIDRREEY